MPYVIYDPHGQRADLTNSVIPLEVRRSASIIWLGLRDDPRRGGSTYRTIRLRGVGVDVWEAYADDVIIAYVVDDEAKAVSIIEQVFFY